MPWLAKGVIEVREEFIKLAEQREISFTKLCSRYSISTKTGYKWLKRYKDSGLSGLSDQSRTPKSQPAKTSGDIEQRVLGLRLKHSAWGGRKIRHWLINKGFECVPAASTISDILRRNGLLNQELSQNNKAWKRFEHKAPNDLWQIDFKGHFPMSDGKRCHPLTIVDDHSRFSLAIQACLDEQAAPTKEALRNVLKQYGLPKRINFDNGSPWGSIFYSCRYTAFSLWLIDQGIEVSYSRPRHPQTNGKNERFNRSLLNEVIENKYIRDLLDAQTHFDEWRHIYNFERPHEGLQYKVPSDRYKPSYRSYNEQVRQFKYGPEYLIKYTSVRGVVSLAGRQIFIGVPFAKKEIGLRQASKENPSLIELYYRHQRLGAIDLDQMEKYTPVNLYSKL